jgi:hypothetical protein
MITDHLTLIVWAHMWALESVGQKQPPPPPPPPSVYLVRIFPLLLPLSANKKVPAERHFSKNQLGINYRPGKANSYQICSHFFAPFFLVVKYAFIIL